MGYIERECVYRGMEGREKEWKRVTDMDRWIVI